MMCKLVFTINGFEHPHIGYTNGDNWNGWATPYFEVDEAFKIVEEYNKETEFPILYNEETDTFAVKEMGELDGDNWKGVNCQTEDGIKHLYGIGAYAWIWDFVSQSNIKSIANVVEDFLWEFDTYEHRDNYNGREELIEAIIDQLKDLNVLKQVLTYLYTEELSQEELYNKLRKELKL